MDQTKKLKSPIFLLLLKVCGVLLFIGCTQHYVHRLSVAVEFTG